MSEMMWADGVVLMWGGRADHMDLDKLMDVDDLEHHEGDDFALPQVRPLVRPSALNTVASIRCNQMQPHAKGRACYIGECVPSAETRPPRG
jgi:hypothetical protein